MALSVSSTGMSASEKTVINVKEFPLYRSKAIAAESLLALWIVMHAASASAAAPPQWSELAVYASVEPAHGTAHSTEALRSALQAAGYRLSSDISDSDVLITLSIGRPASSWASAFYQYAFRLRAMSASDPGALNGVEYSVHSNRGTPSRADLDDLMLELAKDESLNRWASEEVPRRERRNQLKKQEELEAKEREERRQAEELRASEERSRKDLEADDRAWMLANAERCESPAVEADCDGVRAYLSQYPRGAHAAQASEGLRKSQASILEKKKAAQEKFIASTVSRHSKRVAALGFSSQQLKSVIYLQVDHLNAPQPFMPLGRWLSLLFENQSITRVLPASNGTRRGVSIKSPGRMSFGFLFHLDEGDAYLTHVISADTAIPIESSQDRYVASMTMAKLAYDAIPSSMMP